MGENAFFVVSTSIKDEITIFNSEIFNPQSPGYVHISIHSVS